MTESQSMTPAQHLEQVQSRYDDSRLGEVVKSAVEHLHAFVEEVGLTREEWFAGIDFLTRTGQMCNESRQEFILLSDTLGVSMLVEMINHAGATGTTEPTVFGPFHVEGAVRRAAGESIVVDPIDGPQLLFRGRVLGLDGDPVEGATLDVWQTAGNGFYDVQDSAQTPGNMRGVFTTDAEGRYAFRTVRPVDYMVPSDGPTGELLVSTGRHPWRPAHTHVVVVADGYKPLITHLFDADSGYLHSDAVFGVRPSLVVDMSGPEVTYDFVLDRAAQP
jgi:hydroxyquinol 1,2-dioxygenase